MEILKIDGLEADTAPPTTTPDAQPSAVPIPAVIVGEGPEAAERFLTFFTDTIRNPNTRAAYYRNARRFFHWCEGRGLALQQIKSYHIEELSLTHEPPSVKQHLAAIRMLLD